MRSSFARPRRLARPSSGRPPLKQAHVTGNGRSLRKGAGRLSFRLRNTTARQRGLSNSEFLIRSCANSGQTPTRLPIRPAGAAARWRRLRLGAPTRVCPRVSSLPGSGVGQSPSGRRRARGWNWGQTLIIWRCRGGNGGCRGTGAGGGNDGLQGLAGAMDARRYTVAFERRRLRDASGAGPTGLRGGRSRLRVPGAGGGRSGWGAGWGAGVRCTHERPDVCEDVRPFVDFLIVAPGGVGARRPAAYRR